MHILLTGGTGLIGRRLCRYWLTQGHQLTVCSRQPQRVAALCGSSVRAIGTLAEYGEGPLDAVVNLAGAPIADRPWTSKRKALLLASRVALSAQLVTWLDSRAQRPQVLISGSAVGWYGDGGEHVLTEASPAVGDDFAAQLCTAWEFEAQQAQALGIRVVIVRTGLVLANEGGFLARLLLPFKLALGGPIGNGRQWMPWIHLDDQVRLIDFLIGQNSLIGVFNACAPQPVRNADFARALGRVLHRPALLPAPAWLLRLGLGELAGLLLGGQRALPNRLLAAGFEFTFNDLPSALNDLLGPEDVA
ncbi:MAG: TIGR01777 family oxidoreductase [Pseudomonadaceae bacterium]|jgi:uncharacterized protein (TIGR01777 family)|nr:TIGR01777 family oxidoreductase [Pseudomonadaceae bacterium]